MARDFGTVKEDASLNVFYSTSDGSGGRVTQAALEEGDFVITKDGSAMTLDASTITHDNDFNTDTGIHKVTVDLSNDADFTTGSDYCLYMHPDTEQVDSQDQAAILAYWKIESDSEKAVRLLQESAYPTDGVISTTTGNATGRINLTDVVDAQTADADLVGSKWLVRDITNDQTVEVTVTSVQSARLFNVETSAAGDAMDFTVAAGDYVLFVGFANVARIMSIEDGTNLTEAGGTGDHLTAIPASVILDALGGISGTAETGTLSTTDATTDLTGYADDELIGRTIVFTSGTADGQSGRITDYANTNGQVTYTTLATAPVNGDTFVIL